MITYAQNLEDVVLNRVFRSKPSGFYIDVGAHDPVALSVTKFFYDLGWHGINIEPVPASFQRLAAGRPRDVTLNLGVSDRHDILTLYEVTGHPELTSLDEEVARRAGRQRGVDVTTYSVEVRTLAEICDTCGVQFIDFIKIDVEGREKEVIAGADWQRYRPTMLVVEATVPLSGAIQDWDRAEDVAAWHAWEPMLLEAGYLMVYYDGLNRYYLREEDAHLKTRFSVPVARLQDDFTFYREVQQREQLDALAAEADRLREHLAALETSNQTLDAERARLNDALVASEDAQRRFTAEAERLQEHLATLEASNQALDAERARLGEALAAAHEAQRRLTAEANDLREHFATLEASNQALDAERARLDGALAAAGEAKQHLAGEVKRLKKIRRRLQGQIRYRDKKAAAQKEQIAQLEHEQARLQQRLDASLADHDALGRTLGEAHEANGLLMNTVRTLEASVHRLEEEQARLGQQLGAREEELRVLRATLAEERYRAQRRGWRRLLAPPGAARHRAAPASESAPAAGSQAPAPPSGEERRAGFNGTHDAFRPVPAGTQPSAELIAMHLETSKAYQLAFHRQKEAIKERLQNENALVAAARRRAYQWGRYERLLKPASTRLRHLFRRTPGNGTPTPESRLHAVLKTPFVQALVAARSLPGAVPEEALETLYEAGQHLTRVLALGAGLHPAVHMLSHAGAQGTWLDAGASPPGMGEGWTAAPVPLAEWLLTQKPAALRAYDAVLLGEGLDEVTRTLLQGRLDPGTRLLVCSGAVAAPRLPGAGAEPAQTCPGLAIYAAPPAWVDPLPELPDFYERDGWPPAAPAPAAVPPVMPSGRPWPRISVVTVTLNQGAFLEQTIRSVLAQGYPNLEYIVLDGGSTDGTPAILDRYRPALAHCISEPDGGQSDALNKGFRRATGELLAWINSDDCYPPGALLRAALAFDTYPTDMVVGGCALVQGTQPTPFQTHHTRLPVGRVEPLPLDRLLDIDGAWLKGDFFYQPEVFWTRALWEQSGGHVNDELFYSMDYDLWVRMAQQGARIVHIPEPLAIYRMHEQQKTSGGDLPYVPELRRINAVHRAQYELS